MDERDVEVRYESVSWTVATVRSCPRLQNAFRIYKTLILIWEKLLTTTVVKLKGNTGTRLVLGRKYKIELPHHKLLWDYTNRCRCRRGTSTVEDRASSTMTCRWGYICWHLDWSDDNGGCRCFSVDRWGDDKHVTLHLPINISETE